MNYAERITVLDQVAEQHVGRLELRCQVAMADIYKAAAMMPAGVEIPNGPRDWARAQARSLIVEWLSACRYFVQVDVAAARAGDLLVFQLGHAPHHVAVQLSGGRLVHVFGEHGVQIAPCIPTPWAKRIHSVWRPRMLINK